MLMTSPAAALVFVYGTLKKSFYNHRVYLSCALTAEKASFVSPGTTVEAYPLVIGSARSVPFLLSLPRDDDDTPSTVDGVVTHRIEGEIYDVDGDVMEALDLIEGVQTGRYRRVTIDVEVPNDGAEKKIKHCWVYVKNCAPDDELLQLPTYGDYTQKLHENYQPTSASPSESVLALMKGESRSSE